MRPGVVLAVMYSIVELAYVVLMIAAAVSKIVEFGWLDLNMPSISPIGPTRCKSSSTSSCMLPVPILIAVDVDDSKLELLGRFAVVAFVPLWVGHQFNRLDWSIRLSERKPARYVATVNQAVLSKWLP